MKAVISVNVREDKDVEGSKWVDAVKKNNNGADNYKGRCVAKGYSI